MLDITLKSCIIFPSSCYHFDISIMGSIFTLKSICVVWMWPPNCFAYCSYNTLFSILSHWIFLYLSISLKKINYCIIFFISSFTTFSFKLKHIYLFTFDLITDIFNFKFMFTASFVCTHFVIVFVTFLDWL